MLCEMKVADLGVDLRIVDILKEQGIEDLYPPRERAIPLALEGKSLVHATPNHNAKYYNILHSITWRYGLTGPRRGSGMSLTG